MKMKAMFAQLVWLPFICLVAGCSTPMSLQYAKPATGQMNRGKICVVVNDKRSSEAISNDPYRVGTIRNTFGVPFALRSREGRKPPTVIKELVSDCLNAAGYEVVEQSDNLPRLVVDLQSFWSDGYQHNRMWLSMVTALKSNSQAQPVWSKEIESNVGITWLVGYGTFDKGFTKLLEDAKQKLMVSFNTSDFRQSLENSL
jgi:hypothetical protein